MEPASLAIGVPALASLFLKASVQGYEVLTDAKNASVGTDGCAHSFRMQRQKLLDWKATYGGLLEGLESTDRYLLIVQTLARIACLFARIGDIANEYPGDRPRGRGDSQCLSPPEDSRKHKRSLSYRSTFRRLKSRFGTSSDQETPRQHSPSPAPSLFDVKAIVPNNIKREELESLGREVGKSGISIHGLRWALRDKKKLEELLEQLKDYTRSLLDISKPLLSGVAAPNTKTTGCLFTVPFPRNPDYVEREVIHKRLDELLLPNDGPQRRAALWALGGMGKTTTAIAYCHQKAESPISVFWVHGNSNETFQASYQDIHKSVGIKTPDGDVDALQSAVKNWLESPESGQWIMVIDNLDNPQIESKYIPARRGSILFTTRDRRILSEPRFAVPTGADVELEKMSFDEAASMCRNLGMGDSRPSSSQAELLDLLENLPLAIAQAAAYIRRTRTSAQQYLELFKGGESRQATLLSQPLHSVSADDSGASQITMRTWGVTIDRIRAENALAIDILRFMSVIDSASIEMGLIRAASTFRGTDEIDLFESVGVLFDFSLISMLDPSHYRVHRLVSLYSRLSIQGEERRRALGAAAESILRNSPEDVLGNLPRCSRLLPHATTVLLHARESDTNFDEEQRLQEFVGSIFYSQREHDKALEWYQQALGRKEQALGKNHPDTLTTVHNMASVFRNQGEYEKALQWYQRALDGGEQALGKNHPSTLTTIHNMASVFRNQGEYEKALQWYQRALDGEEQVLGKNHPSTLTTVHNMASVFRNQGEYEKALQWYQRALDGEEQALGKNHPDTLITVHSIALVFDSQGEYEKALQWYQRALDAKEQALGKNHPSTLTTAHNMASVFRNQGEYEKALQWYQRALDCREQALGKDHSPTLATARCVRRTSEKSARGATRKFSGLFQKYAQ